MERTNRNSNRRNGLISDKNGRKVSYGELIGGKRFDLPLNPQAKRKEQSQWKVLGSPVPSLDRAALMTGQFEFVHNVRVPGMLHGRVVRPPDVGATLAHVDDNSVRQIPGFVKVVVRKNFVGVVAERQHEAIQAARQLKVTWNPLQHFPHNKLFMKNHKTTGARHHHRGFARCGAAVFCT